MHGHIFKNQYTLERMIVWIINPLELKSDDSIPRKKMIHEKNFQTPTPKKLNVQIYTLEKYTLR